VTESRHGKTIVTPVEVGIGEAQVLVVSEIPLTPAARRIIDIFKEVQITQCKVIDDKVIINGILEKTILFLNMGPTAPIFGRGKNSDEESHMANRVAAGEVKAVFAELPFALFIDVPGAQPGDECIIEVAEVVGEKDDQLKVQEDGSFKVLLEKAVVRVIAKVTRREQIPI